MISIEEMLLALMSKGWSQPALAEKLDTTQPTIHRLAKTGQVPSYDLGKRIELLYDLEIKSKAA